MKNRPASSLMGEDKKYFLNQFHELENQFKKALCRNGVLAAVKLIFKKLWIGNPFVFLNFFRRNCHLLENFWHFYEPYF